MQGSASECVLVALLAARAEALKQMKQKFPFVEEGVLLSRLIAYCSKEVQYVRIFTCYVFTTGTLVC